MAAHTGMRRSELIRMQVTDVDFEGGSVLIREKKRVKGKRSTRRAPLTPLLATALQAWLAVHPGGNALFCQSGEVRHSKKRSRTTGHQNGKGRATTLKGRMATVKMREDAPGLGPLTVDECHDHFKRTLAGTEMGGGQGAFTRPAAFGDQLPGRRRGRPADHRRHRRAHARGDAATISPPDARREESGGARGVRVRIAGRPSVRSRDPCSPPRVRAAWLVIELASHPSGNVASACVAAQQRHGGRSAKVAATGERRCHPCRALSPPPPVVALRFLSPPIGEKALPLVSEELLVGDGPSLVLPAARPFLDGPDAAQPAPLADREFRLADDPRPPPPWCSAP